MTERTDSTFDVEGESAWDIADKCEAVREQWASDAQKTAREDADYGELFRTALIVRERLGWCWAEVERIANEAAVLRRIEVAANKEAVPEELSGIYRADFRAEAEEDANTVFPADTADNLQSVAGDLSDLFSTETFDRLKFLADLWEAHWARRHDVNEPVTK